jgi:hypothetical protein
VLPAAKVSPEIAAARGVPIGRDCVSPPWHSEFSTPRGLLEFIERLRRLALGKPVGFKLCIGHPGEFLGICKAMLETSIYPDFIVVDGAEGGTGAGPLEFLDHVGMPLRETAYTQRIETIAGMFRDKKIPLIWVGLPILKSERLSANAVAFNQFYRAYAEKAGASYIDIWEAFADEAGQYSASGPDINGQTVRLRAGDGVHFTKAGARKLAHFVEPEIRRKLEEVLPNIAPEMTPGLAPNPANGPNDGSGTPANVSALPGGQTTGATDTKALEARSRDRRSLDGTLG